MLKTIWADEPAIHPGNTPSGMADEPVEPEVEEDDDSPVHRGPAWDLSVIRNAVFEIDSKQDVTDDESFDDETATPGDRD